MPAKPEIPAWLVALAQERGFDRRTLLRLLVSGGVAAVLMACAEVRVPGEAQTIHDTSSATAEAGDSSASPVPRSFFKDSEPFIQRGASGLESRLENMQGFITPNRLFFVRNNSRSMEFNADDWRLSVSGDAVSHALELTYADIRRLPSRTIVSYLECAGNHRAMFDVVKGEATKGTQWSTGAVGNAVWTGVSLRDILKLAGVSADAASALLVGLDAESPEEGWRRALPIEKALEPDTILAYAMNGEDLPMDHGFPLRALVPGWVGSASVKWLGRIVVSANRHWTRNNTTSYVLIGDAYPPEGQAQGRILTTQVIKSALALPWPAELAAGTHRLHGYAHSPFGAIARVDWSADAGATWNESRVLEPQIQHSWARFEFAWDAQAGEHTILTRATDTAGNSQPDEIPFNEKGYLFNQPLPHPISVK